LRRRNPYHERVSTESLHAELEAERALARTLGPYVGQWVGVADHKVVAHAPTFEELAAIVDVATVATFQVVRGPIFV
jgi:hypothetical protein